MRGRAGWMSRSMVWSMAMIAGGVLSGCGGGSAPTAPAPAAPATASVDPAAPAPAAAPAASASTAGQSKGLVRTDAQGRKWIGEVPYDVFYDDPLAVASQQAAVATTVAATATPTPSPAATPTPMPMPPPMPQPAAGGGADWKQIIPAPVIEAEVKELRNLIGGHLQSLGQFKREYKDVQWDGAALSAMGGIANRHPDAVSWKDKAKYIRYLGSQLEQTSQESNREAFDKATVLAEQLQVLLSGGKPADLPADVPDQKPFGESADRYGMMKRINRAFSHLKSNINTPERLKEQKDSVLHEAAIMAAFAQAIADPSYTSADEKEYQDQAKILLEAGLKMQTAAQTDDYTAFSAGLDAANKSCSDCHQQYRFE